MLEPEQLAALRRCEQQTDVPIARQIRRAIDYWLKLPAVQQEVVRAFDEAGFNERPAKSVRKKAAPRRARTRRKA